MLSIRTRMPPPAPHHLAACSCLSRHSSVTAAWAPVEPHVSRVFFMLIAAHELREQTLQAVHSKSALPIPTFCIKPSLTDRNHQNALWLFPSGPSSALSSICPSVPP